MICEDYHKHEFQKFLEYESSTGWYLSLPDWLTPLWFIDWMAERLAKRTAKKYERYRQFKELEQQMQ